MSENGAEIARLDDIVTSLPVPDRELFQRIYDVSITEGRLNPPPDMKPWIEEHFGAVDKILAQKVIRVTNIVTLEEALFNELRASRPEGRSRAGEAPPGEQEVHGTDLFDDPLATTPEDTFGRIEGKYCITGSNVAKYEGYHAVIIFNEPDPMRFNIEQVADYIDTGLRWARKAHAVDPEANGAAVLDDVFIRDVGDDVEGIGESDAQARRIGEIPDGGVHAEMDPSVDVVEIAVEIRPGGPLGQTAGAGRAVV